jgi:hypothetical protein
MSIAHRYIAQREADATKLTHAVHGREHLLARVKEPWAAKHAEKGSDDRTLPFFVVEGLCADECENAVIMNQDEARRA